MTPTQRGAAYAPPRPPTLPMLLLLQCAGAAPGTRSRLPQRRRPCTSVHACSLRPRLAPETIGGAGARRRVRSYVGVTRIAPLRTSARLRNEKRGPASRRPAVGALLAESGGGLTQPGHRNAGRERASRCHTRLAR